MEGELKSIARPCWLRLAAIVVGVWTFVSGMKTLQWELILIGIGLALTGLGLGRYRYISLER